jgi:U3 small nucleolar RNA-associated protein 20
LFGTLRLLTCHAIHGFKPLSRRHSPPANTVTTIAPFNHSSTPPDAATTPREANVTDAAVTALRAAAGKLPWPAYSALLHQWLRLLEARAAAKPVVRAVCAVLDGFHFPLPQEDEGLAEEGAAAAGAGGGDGAAANGGDQEVDGAEDEGAEEGGGEGRAEGEEGAAGDEEGDEEEEQGPEEEAAVAAAADEEAPPEPAAADEGAAAAVTPEERERRRRAALAAEAQRVLRGKVLPALHGALVEQQWESVRPPVAVAIVKLLKVGLGLGEPRVKQ